MYTYVHTYGHVRVLLLKTSCGQASQVRSIPLSQASGRPGSLLSICPEDVHLVMGDHGTCWERRLTTAMAGTDLAHRYHVPSGQWYRLTPDL
jgi:hypothetical protein